MATHEDFSRLQQVKSASNRAFGWTFVAVLLIVALWPLVMGAGVHWWSLIAGAVMMLLTLVAPAVLTFPNRLWLRFGALLHRIVSPVMLAIMFYAIITPMGLLMRSFGKDFLRLRRDNSCGTYWIRRDPPGPEPRSMSKQF